jgi:hypothetical protein
MEMEFTPPQSPQNTPAISDSARCVEMFRIPPPTFINIDSRNHNNLIEPLINSSCQLTNKILINRATGRIRRYTSSSKSQPTASLMESARPCTHHLSLQEDYVERLESTCTHARVEACHKSHPARLKGGFIPEDKNQWVMSFVEELLLRNVQNPTKCRT